MDETTAEARARAAEPAASGAERVLLVRAAPAPAEPAPAAPPPRALPPAAQRALAEAEARRAALDVQAREAAPEREVHGRGGVEPVRYGDWEIKGVAIDFS